MRKFFYTLFLCFIFIGSAQAAEKTASALTSKLTENQFGAELQSGFHFNEQAPNKIVVDDETLKPEKLSMKSISFPVLPNKWQRAIAYLYVCDNALTVCEMHNVDLKTLQESKSDAAATPTKNNAEISRNKYGFFEDNWDYATKLAKEKHALLLVDFSAIWCPGCVRLENEVFRTNEFQELTRHIVKLRIDRDRFENDALYKKFNVPGIPVLLFLNSDAEEIARVNDFLPLEKFKEMLSAVQSDPTPLATLVAQSKVTETNNLALGLRLYYSWHMAEAIPYLEKVQPAPSQLLSAKVELAEQNFSKDKSKQPEYIAILRSAIHADGDSTRSLGWRSDLVGLLDKDKDAAEIKKLAESGDLLTDKLLANKALLKKALASDEVGEYLNYEALMVANTRAELLESAGYKDEKVVAAWKKAVAVAKELKITAQQRGPAMRYLSALIQAKLLVDADKLAEALLKEDPGSTDLMRRRAKILVQLQQFPEAIELAQKSLKGSYAQNEFYAADVLAKAYIGAHKNIEAKTLLDDYLNRSESKWPDLASTTRDMEKLRAQL